jgi:hypothetical protein
MVAPFLPPLKKWINQQKKRDAARQAHVEPVVEEALAMPSDSLAVDVPAANAAFELKRLLSVNLPGQNSPQTAGGEGNQGNALLAMLRGNASSAGLAPPANNDLPPATPLDQVTHTPPEPGTPHYQHHQPSPAVRQQPPPGFPFPSPAHQRNVSLHPPGFFGQNAHENLQRMVPDMSHMSQQPPHAVRHIHPQGPHPSMQQQLFPGGHPAPIGHGPVAPSASQLPAPRLNNHAMNLLSAFKGPSQSPIGHNAMPYGSSLMSFPGSDQNHMQAQQQQPTGDHQQPRRRSEHQNSLLGLFTSPDPPRATPVSQPPQTSLPVNTAQSPGPTVPTPQQRSASTAMFTRTLPKVKPTAPPAQTNMDMFPAKHIVQEVQAAQNRALQCRFLRDPDPRLLEALLHPRLPIRSKLLTNYDEATKVILQPASPFSKDLRPEQTKMDHLRCLRLDSRLLLSSRRQNKQHQSSLFRDEHKKHQNSSSHKSCKDQSQEQVRARISPQQILVSNAMHSLPCSQSKTLGLPRAKADLDQPCRTTQEHLCHQTRQCLEHDWPAPLRQ